MKTAVLVVTHAKMTSAGMYLLHLPFVCWRGSDYGPVTAGSRRPLGGVRGVRALAYHVTVVNQQVIERVRCDEGCFGEGLTTLQCSSPPLGERPMSSVGYQCHRERYASWIVDAHCDTAFVLRASGGLGRDRGRRCRIGL